MESFEMDRSYQVSVIVPVQNSESYLGQCLRALRKSTGVKHEIIVVSDHSEDRSVEIAYQYADVVILLESSTGANSARNAGADIAKGNILVFVDSDVKIERDTLAVILERIEEDNLDAVVGLYTTKHKNENLVSQYKNLWIRYSYLKSKPSVDWLFGAISGIRKEIFHSIGGFNQTLIARSGNDDIELGKRLHGSSYRIALDTDVEVEHLKHYTLLSFVKNEYHRSAGFVSMAREIGEFRVSILKGFANVYPAFVWSTILVPLMLILGVLFISGTLNCKLGYLLGVIYLIMNIRFLNYLEQVRGFFAMIAMIPILILDHLVCFVGSFVGVTRSITAAIFNR